MAPIPDIPSRRERLRMRHERANQTVILERLAARFGRPGRQGKRGREGGEGVPVDPNKPSHLTGGAAAALDFGED